MKNLRKRTLSILLILCLFCSFSMTAFASSDEEVIDKWASVPVTVYATNQLSNYEIQQLIQAIGVWNSTRVGTVLKYGGVKNYVSTPGWDKINCVGKLRLQDGVNGNTILDHNNTGEIIIEGDIFINNKISFSQNSSIKLESVLVHELGHFLGLDHINNINSVMYPYYTGRVALDAIDINDLDNLY